MNTRLFTLIAASVIFNCAMPTNAATIHLSPSSANVVVGAVATVDLTVSGLGDGSAPSLGTFDLDIEFDPSVLSFSGATFGNQLDLFSFGSFQSITIGTGSTNLFELSFDLSEDLDALQLGSFLLATLSFDAISSGDSGMNVIVNAISDSVGAPLESSIVLGQFSVQDVSAVPEPASWALFGLGLLGVVALARTRGTRFSYCPA